MIDGGAASPRRADGQQPIGNGSPHTRAAAPRALEVAFGAKLVVREHHGVARDAEVGGEHAGGGQARTGREAAGEDRLAQAVVELAVERRRRARIERDEDYRCVGSPPAARWDG